MGIYETFLLCWLVLSVPMGMLAGQFISVGEREDLE